MNAEAKKNWGTFFMGTGREIDLDQLAAAAPKGGKLWNRDQESIYLERVTRRAEEQARTILAQARQERAALLEETRGEITRMWKEAQQLRKGMDEQAAALQAESQSLKDETARLHEEARRLHADAKEAGHAAGVGQAQAELTHFRAVMGESVGAVLLAIHAQCERIFDAWKEDLCALVPICVEKATGLVLDRDRALLLEQLFLDSVRLFAARTAVLVRVRPDDEAVVADMLAAAKERIAGLGSWITQGDPELALGDLVLEAAHSHVESRIEERTRAVDAALRHLLLPASAEETQGQEELAQINAEAVARMLALVPKQSLAPGVSHGAHEPHLEAEKAVYAADAALHAMENANPDEAEEGAEDSQAPKFPAEISGVEGTHGASAAANVKLSAMLAPPEIPAAGNVTPKVDLSRVRSRQAEADAVAANAITAQDAVDAVLAEGGFLPATGEA